MRCAATISLVALLAGLPIIGTGCTPQDRYDQALLANQTLKEQLVRAEADRDAALGNLRAAQSQLGTGQSELGDLARRKLMPALFGLDCEKLLPDGAAVIGFARSEMTDEPFRASLREAAEADCDGGAFDEDAWRRFAARVSYHRPTACSTWPRRRARSSTSWAG